MTIHDAIRHVRTRLERAGLCVGDAAFDAEVLARHALGGWERGQLVVHLRDDVPTGFIDTYGSLAARREKREPTAYIIGSREFWGLQILVGPGVLIPRPETELIVEEVLNRLPVPENRSRRVADVGTGSGCLAVALAHGLPHARVVAIDVSDEALAIARRNVDHHGVAERVMLVRADLFTTRSQQDSPRSVSRLTSVRGSTRIPDPALRRGSGRPERAAASRTAGSRIPMLFDVIVSNPPYVPAGDIVTLQPDIRDYEPTGALDGGSDGLDVIRRLVPASARVLAPAGMLVFEFGFGQESGVRRIVEDEPDLRLLTIRTDYAGIPRVAVAKRVAVD